MAAKLLAGLRLKSGDLGGERIENALGFRVHGGAKMRRHMGRKTAGINPEFVQTDSKCPLCGNGFTPDFLGGSGVILCVIRHSFSLLCPRLT